MARNRGFYDQDADGTVVDPEDVERARLQQGHPGARGYYDGLRRPEDDWALDGEAAVGEQGPSSDADDDPHSYDFEYEVLRPESSAARKILTVLLLFIVAVGLVVGGAVWWVTRQLNPPGPPGDAVRFTIPSGSSTSAIADLLEEEGVIESATVFRQYLRYKGVEPFLAGEFVLQENSAMWDVVDVLQAGPAPLPFQEFTVPEGLTVGQIPDEIVDDLTGFGSLRFTELIGSNQIRSRYQPPQVTTLEGFLFPETYRVEQGQDETAILTQMVGQFDAVGDEIGLNQAPQRVGLSPYEVLIVASLVQEEARIPEDAPKIARVIYNRLAAGTPLGVDATICYEVGEQPCALTTDDLERDSPYNSRLRVGLPPTPIAAPGRAALEAALNPAEGPWIYYVLDPNAATPGGHFFTDSFDEFNRVKNECEAAGLGCG